MSQGDGMDEITGRDLNDDDLRMETEIVATDKSQDDEPDSEAAPQSADAGKEEDVQDADESKKPDEKDKGDGDADASDEKSETEIV